MRSHCSTDLAPFSQRTYTPVALEKAGCIDLVHLVAYRAGRRGVAEQLILRCKDINDRVLFDYLAADLMLPTYRALAAMDISPENAVIVHAPRSPAARRAVGHDQSKQLARTLAKKLDITYFDALCHTGTRKQQKELTAKQRLAHAAASYKLRSNIDLHGKTVLLVDDICTTGATLAACTRLLLGAAADRVISVCVAVSEQ